MTDTSPGPRAADSTLLDELRTHIADETPSCNARTDYLLRRAVAELERLATQPPYRALLALLEADRAKALRNAPLCTVEEVRWANEGMAAAHLADAAHVLAVFEGPEAAAEYMRQTGQSDALGNPDAKLAAGLREQYATAIRALNDGGTLADLDEEDDVYRLADTVLAVRDRRLDQLAAGRATWKAKAEEIERDRDRLAAQVKQLIERLGQYADRGIQNGERAERAAARVRAECDAMDQAMANGHASLSRLREHITRIRAAVDAPKAEQFSGEPK